MTTESDTWAQTLITVTPEDDATLREISYRTTLSSTPDAQLILDPDEIVYRRSFTHRQFVDSKDEEEEKEEEEEAVSEEMELEMKSKQDAESQTYLQGTKTVHISAEYRDEASQTMYMSTPCPPLKYFKDIVTSMKENPMPKLKRSNVAATIISIHPKTSHDVAMKQLSTDVREEEREKFETKHSTEEEAEMEVTEILHFLIARAFWIENPSQAQVVTTEETAQTCIIYNNRQNIFLMDSEVQTDLSCEPKQSNTMLLTDYWETKNMIFNYLEDCISKGIEIRMIIDDIIDEIVDKCAGIIKYPMKEQMIQTLATYKLVDGEKEEDVLRKLKLDVIVDPLEASIIVIPLMENLLQLVSEAVSTNAAEMAEVVLDRILQRTMTIIRKLTELQKQSERKPIDEILAKRKRKIVESMLRKDTETISTQTSIVGISEVRKMKKSKEVLCSVCRRQSMCQWCLNDQEIESVSEEGIKMLRTQDILLAYKPCYIVTKVSEKSDNFQPPCPPPKRKVKPPFKYQLRSQKASTEQCSNAIYLFSQAGKNVETQESFNEWSYVTDATTMKPYSIKESVNSLSQTTIPLLDQSTCQNSFSHRSTLTSRAENALQILKDTFCSHENCIASSLQTLKFTKSKEMCTKQTYNTCLNINNIDNKIFGQEICIQQTCKIFSNLRLPKTSTDSIYSHISIKSHGDGFNIVPIYLSQNFCTKEFQ